MSKLPPTPPFYQRLIVGTIAVFTGMYAFWQVGKDFQFVKFEPRSPEEIEQRKRDRIGISIKHLDTRTLEYTPEAKERLNRELEERRSAESEEKH